MICCDEEMWKFERMAIHWESKWVPVFIWYCEQCERTMLEEEEE